MKSILYLVMMSAVLFTGSCTKEESDPMMVVKDQSGDYLRMQGKDYRICNTELTREYPDNSYVIARFRKIDACGSLEKDRPAAALPHANEGWIIVDYIR